jgi:hypothetical protein
VLTEKPFASNATEAAQVRDLAQGRSLVVFEGFHYLYHPLMTRLMSLLADGELGALQRVESTLFMSAPPANDPRWSLALAGGALMDLGCYARCTPNVSSVTSPAANPASSAQRVLNVPALPASTRGPTRTSSSPPAQPVSPGAA